SDATAQANTFVAVIEGDAPSRRVQVIPMPVRAFVDIDPALASFAGQPNNALILPPDPFLTLHVSLIADLVGRYRLPAIGSIPNFARYGGLMAYGNTVKLADQFRQAATYVDRILKGSTPSDLPV